GDDGVISVTVSGGTGSYQYSLDGTNFQDVSIFEGLAAGVYTVTVMDENECISTCTITLERNPCASVGDYVWDDFNDNGIQDPGEDPLEGVIVILTEVDNGNETEIRRDTTDALGAYLFDLVDPGTYKLSFELLPGYVFAKSNQGGDANLDSDADPVTGMTTLFTLGDNEVKLDMDAGMLEPRIELTATPDCIDDAPWL